MRKIIITISTLTILLSATASAEAAQGKSVTDKSDTKISFIRPGSVKI